MVVAQDAETTTNGAIVKKFSEENNVPVYISKCYEIFLYNFIVCIIIIHTGSCPTI